MSATRPKNWPGLVLLSALYRAALARCERRLVAHGLELRQAQVSYPFVLDWDYEAHAPRPFAMSEVDYASHDELELEEPLPGEDVVLGFAAEPELALELLLPLGDYKGQCFVRQFGQFTRDKRIEVDFGVPEGAEREGWPTPLPLEQIHPGFALEELLDLDPATGAPIVLSVTADLDRIELDPETEHAQFGFDLHLELEGADVVELDESRWVALWSKLDHAVRAVAPRVAE